MNNPPWAQQSVSKGSAKDESMTDEQIQQVEDCMNRDAQLSEWEQAFLDSLLILAKPLTEKQSEALDKIWERVTG